MIEKPPTGRSDLTCRNTPDKPASARRFASAYLGREIQIAKPTRVKEKFYLDEFIVPRWGKLRLNQIQPKAVEDWLHTTFDSWWTMHGVRAIMSRVFYYAEGHGLWEEGRRSPAGKAKLGKKRYKNERQILSFEETEEGGNDRICDLNLKYHGNRNYPLRPDQVRVTYKVLPEHVFPEK